MRTPSLHCFDMVCVLSIDWLSIFCCCPAGHFGQNPNSVLQPWQYKRRAYGTQMYKEMYDVYLWKRKICEVQCEPRNALMSSDSVLIKFDNRLLYCKDLWDIVNSFLDNHYLVVNNITRLDICCDFNKLEYGEPEQLILDFLNSKIRHKGKGSGTAYFVHYNKNHPYECGTKQFLNYNGISFGTHTSDVRVYMYNKTLELLTQKDKPYIRDTWKAAGLDTSKAVWRLEVSIKSGGMNIVDKDSGQKVVISLPLISDRGRLKTLYFSYVKKYFAFVRNEHAIRNITREPLLKLFEEMASAINIGLVREVGCSNQSDKVFIKALQTAAERFPYAKLDKDLLESLSEEVASSVDLFKWRLDRLQEWQGVYEKSDTIEELNDMQENPSVSTVYDLGV